MKKQIITIAGRPGSGKSTTAKLVASELGFEHFSSGDLFRALGKERGVDVLNANRTKGVTEELDRIVDAKLREIGETREKLIIDSRTAWHWIPNSFKVFLDLDPEIGAKRILEEINEERLGSEKVHEDPKEYAQHLKKRLKIETERYKKLYNIDPYNLDNYDLVVNTAENDIEKSVKTVIEAYKTWQKS